MLVLVRVIDVGAAVISGCDWSVGSTKMFESDGGSVLGSVSPLAMFRRLDFLEAFDGRPLFFGACTGIDDDASSFSSFFILRSALVVCFSSSSSFLAPTLSYT